MRIRGKEIYTKVTTGRKLKRTLYSIRKNMRKFVCDMSFVCCDNIKLRSHIKKFNNKYLYFCCFDLHYGPITYRRTWKEMYQYENIELIINSYFGGMPVEHPIINGMFDYMSVLQSKQNNYGLIRPTVQYNFANDPNLEPELREHLLDMAKAICELWEEVMWRWN